MVLTNTTISIRGAMDCGIVVSEFEFPSRYYVNFRTNTLKKGLNPLILQLCVSTTTVLPGEWL